MRGLLQKDIYMFFKYCRTLIFVVVVCIAASFVNSRNLFFAIYPCLFSAIVPITLLGYDERSRWSEYCGVLPYSKAQIVSAKYLIGLFAQMITMILSSITQAVRMKLDGTFTLESYLMLVEVLLIIFCAASSLSLPFMFKLGVEKGRIAYYIMLIVVCIGAGTASKSIAGYTNGSFESAPVFNHIVALICIAAVVLYACSWYLSILFYKRRV